MKQLNRWVYAIVGVIVLLFAGLVYAWSVLSTPIGAEFTGWTKAQLSLTFTLVMILFCIGSLLCGLLAGRLSAKNAVRLGAVLFLAGFFIASRCQSPLTLYLGFGVLCGLGSGLSYNAVMSTMVRWFPDRPGLISGVLLMGFGGGSFLIGKLYQAWTPAGVGGWRTSFLVLGIVCFAVLAVCSFFFVAPGADFTAPAVKGGNAVSRPAAADVTPGQMLKKTTFWLYYVWAIAVSAAGLALISQASGVVWQGSVERIIFAKDWFDAVTAFETVYFWPDLPQCFREVYRVLKPGGTFLICNESSGDTDKDKKWTEIIGGMTIYKDAELKTYLEQAGFHDVQIHKKKSWLCITAWK